MYGFEKTTSQYSYKYLLSGVMLCYEQTNWTEIGPNNWYSTMLLCPIFKVNSGCLTHQNIWRQFFLIPSIIYVGVFFFCLSKSWWGTWLEPVKQIKKTPQYWPFCNTNLLVQDGKISLSLGKPSSPATHSDHMHEWMLAAAQGSCQPASKIWALVFLVPDSVTSGK